MFNNGIKEELFIDDYIKSMKEQTKETINEECQDEISSYNDEKSVSECV